MNDVLFTVGSRRRVKMRQASKTALALPLIAAFGCSGPDPSLSEKVQTLEDQLFIGESELPLWNGATAGDTSLLGNAAAIPVCFVDTTHRLASGQLDCTDATSTKDCVGKSFEVPVTGTHMFEGSATFVRNSFREFIRSTIERTWMGVANLEFYGWGVCPKHNGIHRDEDLDGYMVIHMSSLRSEGQSCDPNNDQCPYQLDCDKTTRKCVQEPVDVAGVGKPPTGPRVIRFNWPAMNDDSDTQPVIHEFGHALGFPHEWQRPDYDLPESDEYADDPDIEGYMLTPANDTLSIMDYSDNIIAEELSAWDIAGVQRAYGRKYTGSLIGAWGRCANIEGASTASGASVVSYPCRGDWNDTFKRPSSNYHFESTANSRCLNIEGSVGANPLISWDCNSGTNEDFVFSSVEWRAMGKMCVHRNGNALELRTCTGSSQQKWDFFTETGNSGWRIKSPGTEGRCVMAATQSGALGEQLTMADCDTSETRQRFNVPGNGRIRYQNNPARCLNVSGGSPVSGSPIILWSGCGSNPAYNSQFHLRGRVKSRTGNYCMETTGRGAQIEMKACSSSPQQIWEYYL